MRDISYSEWQSWRELEPHRLPCDKNYLEYLVAEFGTFNASLLSSGALSTLESGFVSILGPTHPTLVKAKFSYVSVYKSVFYFFVQSESSFIVAVSDISIGSPASLIYFPDHDVVFRLNTSVWGPTRAEISNAADTFHTWMKSGQSDATNLIILTGDANFAHHIWNQLGVLDVLAARGVAIKPQTAWVTAEPLGPIDELFPDLSTWTWIRVSEAKLQSENSPDRMFLPVSGKLVTLAAKQRVTSFSRLKASEAARHWLSSNLDSAWVWISVRAENRRPTNQVHVLGELCLRILESTELNVILDGFSLPHDACCNETYSTQYFESRCSDDMKIADDIIRFVRLTQTREVSGRIKVIVGWPIVDVIHVQEVVAFYVCHSGTLQHKIGWFSAADGMIHSSREILSKGPEAWAASQVVGGGRVHAVPEAVITEDEQTFVHDERLSSLEHANYHISDVGKFVDFVMCILTQYERRAAPAPLFPDAQEIFYPSKINGRVPLVAEAPVRPESVIEFFLADGDILSVVRSCEALAKKIAGSLSDVSRRGVVNTSGYSRSFMVGSPYNYPTQLVNEIVETEVFANVVQRLSLAQNARLIKVRDWRSFHDHNVCEDLGHEWAESEQSRTDGHGSKYYCMRCGDTSDAKTLPSY